MAYGVIMCCHLHMPLYILGTFTEYPFFMARNFLKKANPAKTTFLRGLTLNDCDLRWTTWIRTKTNRTKTCCAAITP